MEGDDEVDYGDGDDNVNDDVLPIVLHVGPQGQLVYSWSAVWIAILLVAATVVYMVGFKKVKKVCESFVWFRVSLRRDSVRSYNLAVFDVPGCLVYIAWLVQLQMFKPAKKIKAKSNRERRNRLREKRRKEKYPNGLVDGDDELVDEPMVDQPATAVPAIALANYVRGIFYYLIWGSIWRRSD
jgi:hypothetical protein